MAEPGDGQERAANRLLQRWADAPPLLAGWRALDLTSEQGWLAGRILADFGVEVIKVEPPGGDPSRLLGPFLDNQPDPERSLYWMAYNAGKKGITLDLNSSRDRELMLQLTKRSHFVLESFPPGYLDGLGLGYAALSAANPALIFTSITPFGQSGPRRNYKASDLTLMALGGIMHLTGEADREPLRLMLDQSYYLACGHACVGSMLAHYHRQRSGLGQHVDISILDCLARMNYRDPVRWEIEGRSSQRSGSRMARGIVANRVVWPCKGGYVCWSLLGGQTGAKENYPLTAWIAEEGIPGAERLQQVQWEKVDLALITQEQLDEWEEVIGRFFACHTAPELQGGGTRRRLTIAAMNTVADVRESRQLASRGYWVDVEHADLSSTITYPGHFLLSSATTNTIRRRAPLIGEHNREVFGELEGRT